MVKILHPLDGKTTKEKRDLNSISARRRFKCLLHTKIFSTLSVLTIIMLLAGTVIIAAASSSSFYNITFAKATPIRHFGLLYQENNSFDHYFGTYPMNVFVVSIERSINPAIANNLDILLFFELI